MGSADGDIDMSDEEQLASLERLSSMEFVET